MSDFNFETALVVVVAINLMLFLSQVATININPAAPVFWNYEGSMLGDFDAGNLTLDEGSTNRLPQPVSSVDVDTGNWYTDLFSTIKSWVINIPGAKYVLGVLTAFPNFLKIMGLPNEIVFSLSAFWYMITLFLFVMVLGGKS